MFFCRGCGCMVFGLGGFHATFSCYRCLRMTHSGLQPSSTTRAPPTFSRRKTRQRRRSSRLPKSQSFASRCIVALCLRPFCACIACFHLFELPSLQLVPPEWAVAAETYTKCATEALSSVSLKFNAKTYLFNAMLCTLAGGDIVAADRDLARFKDLDYTFPGKRFCSCASISL